MLHEKLIIIINDMPPEALDELENHVKDKKKMMKKSQSVKKMFKAFMWLEQEDKDMFMMMVERHWHEDMVEEKEDEHPVTGDWDMDLLEHFE